MNKLLLGGVEMSDLILRLQSLAKDEPLLIKQWLCQDQERLQGEVHR